MKSNLFKVYVEVLYSLQTTWMKGILARFVHFWIHNQQKPDNVWHVSGEGGTDGTTPSLLWTGCASSQLTPGPQILSICFISSKILQTFQKFLVGIIFGCLSKSRGVILCSDHTFVFPINYLCRWRSSGRRGTSASAPKQADTPKKKSLVSSCLLNWITFSVGCLMNAFLDKVI